MQENAALRTDAEKFLKKNLVLLQENEKVTTERDKLLTDSMTLIEYNDILQASKDNLEKNMLDIKSRFYLLLKSVDVGDDDSGKADANKPEDKENPTGSGN